MGEYTQREPKWIAGRDRAGDQMRWTMWTRGDRADALGRQTQGGEMERMESQECRAVVDVTVGMMTVYCGYGL
jgi:hypothetical protein